MNKSNAQHAIVLEAIALALAVDAGAELLASGVALLGKFIGLRDPNLKYLGLENMVRLAEVPAVMETVNRWAPGARAVGTCVPAAMGSVDRRAPAPC